MIELAKKKVTEDRVSFICGDIEELSIERQYDLIISNATFQWFNSLHTTIKNCINNLSLQAACYFQPLVMVHFKSFIHATVMRNKSLVFSVTVHLANRFFS
ncbi:methyltransferase domain-containing protein [Priestia megaterium]